jgi:hypothetical protein
MLHHAFWGIIFLSPPFSRTGKFSFQHPRVMTDIKHSIDAFFGGCRCGSDVTFFTLEGGTSG